MVLNKVRGGYRGGGKSLESCVRSVAVVLHFEHKEILGKTAWNLRREEHIKWEKEFCFLESILTHENKWWSMKHQIQDGAITLSLRCNVKVYKHKENWFWCLKPEDSNVPLLPFISYISFVSEPFYPSEPFSSFWSWTSQPCSVAILLQYWKRIPSRYLFTLDIESPWIELVLTPSLLTKLCFQLSNLYCGWVSRSIWDSEFSGRQTYKQIFVI